MKRVYRRWMFLFLLPAFVCNVDAQNLVIASGAGYKALVDQLSDMFTAETGIKVERIYGNMGQVTSQARASGVVDILVGDRSFFTQAGISCSEEFRIGRGRLVLAFASGVGPVSLATLKESSIDRIAQPDPVRAIYGKAASEYLEKSGLAEMIAQKMIVVGTVPQVSAYLISGEVDLGFINLTDALAIQDKIAGYIEVPADFYNPIAIVALKMESAPSGARALEFGRFLSTPAVRKVVEQHGL